MKLIMENWREYVNEIDRSGPSGELSLDGEEFKFSHNLFVDYIQNELDDPEHPELVEFIKNYDARGAHSTVGSDVWRRLKVQANKRMHQEWKWDFPHDIDPEIPCFNKIFYLDALVKSYYDHPEYYDTQESYDTQERDLAVTEAAGDISPYRKCKSDLRDKKAAEKEMEPYELSPELEKE